MTNKRRNNKVPKCGKCSKELITIVQEGYGYIYNWNEQTNKYEKDTSQLSFYYYCGECGDLIGEWSANGLKWGIIPEANELY